MKVRDFALVMIAAVAATTAAQADTVATFADPSPTGTTPLFTFTGNTTAGVLTGGYSGLGLNLLTPGLIGVPDFSDATFAMSPLNTTVGLGGGLFFLSGGSINFFDSAANPLLTITFDSAFLSGALGVGSSDFTGFNVTFSGPILGGYQSITNEAFSFSFANPANTLTGFTATSSFTSSADLVVPAPATAALLGMGGLLAARRRR